MPVALANEFAALWESSGSPPDVFAFLQQRSGALASDKLSVLIHDQQHRWPTDQRLRVEDYLAQLPELASVPDIKLQLAVGEFQAQRNRDTPPSIDEFASRFSDLGDSLKIKLLELIGSDPKEAQSISLSATRTVETAYRGERIGRYRLGRLLGEGQFGRVFLCFDEELQRQVAIKVPTPERFKQPKDTEHFLAEARRVASLDHPHIVPVYDVGRTENGSVYVVSRFIEGCSLGERIKLDRPTHEAAATLLALCAQALHHAHQKRLIHRDIKPANILIEERTGTPYVADFGLAISEEDYLRDGKQAGTPAYMSPEQARGEGHRLDGRSDIFSLGVVLYELLTGQRPFLGSTRNELFHQIISVDPVPPRDVDNSVPAELERICLKALSKRTSDRYATAAEFAEDLLHWQQSPQQPTAELKIVPKGLRSFDADDADYFLDLLPGPRNRAGLPESIQFWKSRIEATDPDRTFSVGLLYGPSGCGKSSLVKAGLLPQLSPGVIAIYIEATPEESETRLLRGLRKYLPDVPNDLGLVATFAALRRRDGKKVVIVLDQFEQWLHAHRAEQNTELVDVLRQCDGVHVQAIIMVRDDFWLAASRFMESVDIPILQGQNIALVDLFDIDHARKVLTKFGQAFGKLPAQSTGLSNSENEFLDTVVNGLAQDGKVVSVRLALFAEMVKGKSWIPATLEEVGGTAGVGVNFLEETFSSRTANPNHRLHQQAARAVLKLMLPEVGTDIKGHMRSHEELLAASGYNERLNDFNELLRILDGELLLITPTDPEGFQSDSESDPGSKYYQLTHDYLVPLLRDWLTRKQRETRRGRAELRLASRAALWNDKPETRHLPSLLEYLNIRLLTKNETWTSVQRKMMQRAGWVHGIRTVVAAALLVALMITGLAVSRHIEEEKQANYAASLVEQLLVTDINEVPRIVDKMAGYGRRTDPLLMQEVSRRVPEQASEDEKERRAKRQAQAAVALSSMGNSDSVWPLLKFSPDPRVRSYLVHWISTAGVDPQTIIERLNEEPDVTIRRALVLSLGEFTDKQLPVVRRQPLIEKLLAVYEDQPDAGLHGAAEWLLRKWGQGIRLKTEVDKLRRKEEQLQAQKATDKRQWYINTQGQTFVVLDAGEFLMGSPESETGRFPNETQHRCHIGRRFAISTTKVTWAQYARFQIARPEFKKINADQYVLTDDSPQVDITWYEAVAYCNWLSDQEGIENKQWCYEPNEKSEYGPGMKAKDKYLELSGYRLPTEAEWEYACRASTVTSRYYGVTDTLLPNYAWYWANGWNRTWPVGSLKPNDFGLFDMQGNAWDWCDSRYTLFPAKSADVTADCGSTKPVLNTDLFVLRGGGFASLPAFDRSANRGNGDQPANRYPDHGIRPARTFP